MSNLATASGPAGYLGGSNMLKLGQAPTTKQQNLRKHTAVITRIWVCPETQKWNSVPPFNSQRKIMNWSSVHFSHLTLVVFPSLFKSVRQTWCFVQAAAKNHSDVAARRSRQKRRENCCTSAASRQLTGPRSTSAKTRHASYIYIYIYVYVYIYIYVYTYIYISYIYICHIYVYIYIYMSYIYILLYYILFIYI